MNSQFSPRIRKTKGHDIEVLLFLDNLLGPVNFSSKLQAIPLLLAPVTEKERSELRSGTSTEGSILQDLGKWLGEIQAIAKYCLDFAFDRI